VGGRRGSHHRADAAEGGRMKVLVSTKETQGQRPNDFCWVPEGEIVKYGFDCDGDAVDGSCGCRRSLVGLECSKATTTMKVAQVDFTKGELKAMLRESLIRDGWMDCYKTAAMKRDFLTREWAAFEHLLEVAKNLPVGTIVERREEVGPRRVVA